MPAKDPSIDAYIAKAAPFAQPILKHVRKLVHANCKDVEEKIKWGFPSFDYKGPMCGMAAFKQHCAVGFWKGEMVLKAVGGNLSLDAMGQFGRITSMKDLPSDATLAKMIKEAKRLNDEGIKSPSRIKPKKPSKPLAMPSYFATALKRSANASKHWEAFSPSKRKDYIEWITEAKTEETREKRLATALEWIGEGKARHWKYERK